MVSSKFVIIDRTLKSFLSGIEKDWNINNPRLSLDPSLGGRDTLESFCPYSLKYLRSFPEDICSQYVWMCRHILQFLIVGTANPLTLK